MTVARRVLAVLACSLSVHALLKDEDNVCSSNVLVGNAVLNAVNLSWPGMDSVRKAVSEGHPGEACARLAAYYSKGKSAAWLRIPPVAPGTGKAGGSADDLLRDIFRLGGVEAATKIPRNADGGIDWFNKGPKNDPEFMNVLNRHASFNTLLLAWRKTGNPVYVKYFDALVADWVLHLPCREGVSRDHWNASGTLNSCAMRSGYTESPWRTLEAGVRAHGPWPAAFFGFQQAKLFSVSSRVLLLLGMSEHNAVLAGPGRTVHTANWVMTQWAGLALSCVAFPELKNSETLLRLALGQLEKLMDDRVYPDGMEYERAFGYDMGAAKTFFNHIQLLQIAGHQPPKASYVQRVEAMFNYGVLVSDQQGFGPRNGDSDLGRSGWYQPAYDYFRRADWLYAHTGGRKGSKPKGQSPSVMFPWGGHAVLKSGFENTGTWACFDVGPYGTNRGHGHRAKLSLTVRANGSMLLVDSGRFQYAGEGFSHTLHQEYGDTTHAHNTLTIDGREQKPAPQVAKAPLPSSNWNFTRKWDSVVASMGLFEGLAGVATHSRAVTYARDRYILVVDRVASDRARAVQATWHAHPNSTVKWHGAASATVLGVSPATGQPTETCLDVILGIGDKVKSFKSRLATGQKKTAQQPWQGWYSQTYSGAWPAPTLVFDLQVDAGNSFFAWLLLPRSVAARTKASVESLSAAQDGRVEVQVRVAGVTETVSVAFGAADVSNQVFI